MNQPIKITYRHVRPSREINEQIRRYTARLHRMYDKITSCRVVMHLPHQNQRKGARYQVRLAVAVPGKYIVVRRAPAARHAELPVAVSDAFYAAEQLLQRHLGRRRKSRMFGAGGKRPTRAARPPAGSRKPRSRRSNPEQLRLSE